MADEEIIDLDAIISKSWKIRFQGDPHVIKPIDVETYLKCAAAFAQLDKLREQKSVAPKDLVAGYAALFSAVSDTLDEKVVAKMSMVQAGALYSQILERVSGRIKAEADSLQEKKKGIVH